MTLSGDIPSVPFPIEAPGECSHGTLRVFPCACGDLEDVTLFFLRDERPAEGAVCPEEIAACIQTDMYVMHRVAPLEDFLRLSRMESGYAAELVCAAVRALDAIPGVIVRLAALLRSLGTLNGSLCTLFRACDATGIVPWLRKMGIFCVQERDEDGYILLQDIPVFWTDMPAGAFAEWLFAGQARVRASLYLYRDGESEMILK
ncbi:MAG: hypothetical protein SOZ52_08650 [Pyramidobacter sp.]|nr:hypothetical protein [Pyramidobacter sp.]